MRATSVFNGLHVVSDLHLGGEPPQGQQRPEHQIFDQGETFAALVAHLLKKPKGETHGLVINGDLVDFLAERIGQRNPAYFDPGGASAALDRIFRDPSFSRVWDALKEFVAEKNRLLIITLGNHDLELALPWVREQLVTELSGGDDAARGRITLCFEPDGFRCRVGNADVLCVHGNEVDTWNVTDYEALRRVCRDAGRGGAVTAWTPNAGTKLVIDVMNPVKERYAFVDLLKPEAGGVLPTLLVLDPRQVARVGDAIPSAARLGWDQLRRVMGFLSEGEKAALGAGRAAPAGVLRAMLGGTFGPAALPRPDSHGLEALLLRTETQFKEGVEPMSVLAGSDGLEFLGFGRALWNLIARKGEDEVLREALERLKADASFDLTRADDAYRALDAQVPDDIDFLVTGHTHLARALPLRGEGRFYFNSGAWVRLIRLIDAQLSDKAAFQPVYAAIKQGRMVTLDSVPDLVLRRPTVVTFWADDEGTHGELRHMAGGKPEPVDRSHFVRR
jgi:UDP-2,3-diacylglucosamine pyrophosphatase LpxH